MSDNRTLWLLAVALSFSAGIAVGALGARLTIPDGGPTARLLSAADAAGKQAFNVTSVEHE